MGWRPPGLSVSVPPLLSPAPQNPEISMTATTNIDGYHIMGAPACLRKQKVGKLIHCGKAGVLGHTGGPVRHHTLTLSSRSTPTSHSAYDTHTLTDLPNTTHSLSLADQHLLRILRSTHTHIDRPVEHHKHMHTHAHTHKQMDQPDITHSVQQIDSYSVFLV